MQSEAKGILCEILEYLSVVVMNRRPCARQVLRLGAEQAKRGEGRQKVERWGRNLVWVWWKRMGLAARSQV